MLLCDGALDGFRYRCGDFLIGKNNKPNVIYLFSMLVWQSLSSRIKTKIMFLDILVFCFCSLADGPLCRQHRPCESPDRGDDGGGRGDTSPSSLTHYYRITCVTNCFAVFICVPWTAIGNRRVKRCIFFSALRDTDNN